MHCFDYLRQTIACASDLTLEGINKESNDTFFDIDGYGVVHMCKSQVCRCQPLSSRMTSQKSTLLITHRMQLGIGLYLMRRRKMGSSSTLSSEKSPRPSPNIIKKRIGCYYRIRETNGISFCVVLSAGYFIPSEPVELCTKMLRRLLWD